MSLQPYPPRDLGLGVNVEPCPEYERAEWGRNLHLEDCCLNCRRLEGCGVLVERLPKAVPKTEPMFLHAPSPATPEGGKGGNTL